MARTLKTAAEILQIVSERIHAIETVKEDGATITVPLPQECVPGPDGCNWGMDYFGNPAGYVDDIQAVLQAAQAQFQLKT